MTPLWTVTSVTALVAVVPEGLYKDLLKITVHIEIFPSFLMRMSHSNYRKHYK